MHRSLTLAAALIALPSLHAQDTRNITEPHLPASCSVLPARLSATKGMLPEAAEKTTDTARIQAAIDKCEKGKAVALRASGARNVFLMGPIELRPGVTLIVDSGVAVFASRNPRDYDLSPGACGLVPSRGPGCKSLINARNAPASGIMGDGAIDGRGGATLLGQDVTWWDISKRAKVLDTSYSAPRMLTVNQSDGFILYRITFRNSFNFHVSVAQTNGFTAWGVKIKTHTKHLTAAEAARYETKTYLAGADHWNPK